MIRRSSVYFILLLWPLIPCSAQIISPIFPSDGLETTTRVTFVWEQVDNADAYRFVVSASPSFATALIDSTISVVKPRNGIETNDLQEFATHGARSDTFFDNLATINDEDWFSFNVAVINTMTEFRFSPPNPGSTEQFGVKIISPSGQLLSGRTIRDIFTYGVPTFEIGKYYIHIKAGIEGNPIFYGDGVYDMLVREAGTTTLGAVIQGVESNDSADFATLGARSETFIDNLSTIDDQDWFSFELDEINTMTRFEFHPPNPGSIERFGVNIISPAGQTLSGRTIGDVFTYSVPTFELGRYLIQIKAGIEGNPIFFGDGSYSIRARKDPATSKVYVDNLLHNHTYFWHVARIGSNNSEEWSPTYSFTAISPVSIDDSFVELPAQAGLDQNFPNPFNPVTTISYDIPATSHVRLGIYDLMGRELEILVDGVVPAGVHETTFNAETYPSGLYLYRLETPQGTFTRSMILLK